MNGFHPAQNFNAQIPKGRKYNLAKSIQPYGIDKGPLSALLAHRSRRQKIKNDSNEITFEVIEFMELHIERYVPYVEQKDAFPFSCRVFHAKSTWPRSSLMSTDRGQSQQLNRHIITLIR